MVTRPPRWVSAEHMITGILWPRARSWRNVFKPSITGISTSSSTTSGRSDSTLASAEAPSAATPATSSLASDPTTVRSRLRITAESSTINIRVRFPGGIG